MGETGASMRDRDRFDAYMRLIDFRMTRWKARNDAEWRISLAFWGLLVSTTFTARAKLPDGGFWWLLPFGVALFYTGMLVWPIWGRNEVD
jgi:hypothetical protein